jgi:hypothetical protein
MSSILRCRRPWSEGSFWEHSKHTPICTGPKSRILKDIGGRTAKTRLRFPKGVNLVLDLFQEVRSWRPLNTDGIQKKLLAMGLREF